GNFPDRLYDTTDTTGFFSFSRVPQGDFTVTAVDPSKPSTGTTTGSITSDGQNVPLEIHGSPTLTITGTVHAANGAGAVEGALVTVGKRSDYTDAAGHFTLDYLPYQFQGTYDIEVTYNGDFAYETLTLTTEDLIRDAGTLTLNGFGTVEGTVSDGTGTLADVPVVLEAGSRRFYTTTDTVGKYSFANVNRGTFSVSSSNGTLGAKAYGKFNVDEPTVTMVTVDLLYEESGTVKGRVLSDETAVADVLVQISGNGQTLTQYTDDLGAFHFNYVKLGAKDLIFVGSPGRAKTTTTLNDSEIPLVLEDTHLDGDSPTIKEFDTAGIIKVNFSEPIEETTLTHGFELYTYAEPRVDVQITPDLSEDDTSVTIIPNEILANNTKYLLKIENMVIEDLAGNKMFGGSEISFTTSDTMAPQVVSLSLKEDEPVSLRPSIEIVFDEILRGESVNNQNIIISPTNSAPGGAIDYTVSLDNEGQNATGQKVTISVMQDLQADTEYTLSINGIQDMLTPPNQQTEQITYSFKTEDNINPILQLGVPEGQGTLVKESSKFIVNVSSPHTDIEKVIFTVAGVTLSTVDCNGNLSVTLTAPTLDQLVNTVGFKVTARAFDMAGNRGDDVILDFTLDKDDAPSINIKREGTDPILPGQKVYFTVDAKDDVKLTKLTVKVNGDVLTTCELGQLGLEEVYAVTIPFDASPLLEFNIIATVEDSNMTTNSDSLELKVPEDTAAPTVTLTDPIPYRRFAYNSIIPIQAEANDDLGIKKVRFSIVEEGLPDVLLQEIDGTPGNSFYAYDEYRVEALLEEKDVKIKAEVVDVADKVTVSMVNVTLKKQLNAGDPTVNITTPTTATLVFPGEILPIRAVAFDDNPLDTMQVYIDDQLWVPGVDELLQITPNGVNMSLAALYKVPAHLSAGTQLKIKVAAVEPNDDENSRSYDFVTVVVVEGSIIETEPDIITVIGHADPENPAATYENDTIIIKSGTVAINGVHNYANVLVKETGRLIHSACTDTTAESLSLNVDDGQIVVGPDATIGGTGLGFLGANQEGNNSKNYGRTKGNAAEGSYWESGGSYGGFGGYVTLTSTNRMNELYGSIYFPTEHGSGGGAQTPEGSYSNIGGNGGGVIDLNSNQLIVDGALESNGGEGQSRAGGGSGGSILLEVSQLLGSGVIKAQGGDSGSNGGGGGGRIAIYYDTDNFISDGITVHGGDCRGNATKYKGGAGTIYLKKSGEPGEIIIGNQKDQTGVSGLVANPPGTITDLTADELTDENAQLVPGSLHGMLLQPNVDRTDTFTIISNTATTIRVHLEVGDLDGLTDVAKIEDTYTIKHTADFLLESRSMHIKGHVSVPSLTLDDESTLVVDGKLEVEGLLSLQSGSTLTHSPATVDDEYKLHIKANSINIHVGCSINADARGYIGAAGLDSARTLNNETVGAAQRYAGGSYGGFGGNGNVSGFPNKTYGSITEPTRPGSGGGRSDHYYGGSGGGVIYIEAQEREVNGSISSNGEIAGRSAGSGSGGAIWLSIGTIKGDGTVQANCVSEDTSCNGGGGRIALYYDTADEFDLDSIQALGGNKSDTTPERNGSAGSVYLKQTDGNGRLIIDNKDLITSNSRIFPVISPSTITAISQDGTTLTDESASYMPGSLIGMKLIPDTDEPGITFDIIGNGRTTITLNGNISADTSVETEYRGIAVFNGDVIIRKTRALMEGDFELGSLTVENSTLTHPDTIPGIESYMYMYIKAGNVSIDADSKIDVTASGFAGSIGRDRDGKYQAPYTSGNTTVGGSPILCGGSYGGLGGRYETDVTDLTVPNKTYGSLYQPFEPGSGGGGYDIDYDDPGSNGGGVVRIVAEGMSLEGEILCNGGQIKNKSAGAGSGGSVWLDVTSLSGSGLIQANGGSGTNRGAGGGGRIAVHYNDIDFNTDNIQTYGGIYTPVIPDPNGWYKDQGPIHNGGAGTIYLQNNGGTEEEKNGHLIVDNNGTITEDSSQVFTTPLPAVGLQDSDSLTMTSGMVYVGADSFIPKALSGMKLTTNLDWDATYPIFDNSDNSIHFTDPNEEAITGTSILGLHHFFKLDVKGNARLSTADRITLSSDTNKIVENGSELQTYEQ
ncbi:MAG: hypothetical protein GY765_20045, partial [bacterium]|nr:hypothetical protein [bacterium]